MLQAWCGKYDATDQRIPECFIVLAQLTVHRLLRLEIPSQIKIYIVLISIFLFQISNFRPSSGPAPFAEHEAWPASYAEEQCLWKPHFQRRSVYLKRLKMSTTISPLIGFAS